MSGFGHRVYKNYDPRAKVIKKLAEEVFSIVGRDPLIEVFFSIILSPKTINNIKGILIIWLSRVILVICSMFGMPMYLDLSSCILILHSFSVISEQISQTFIVTEAFFFLI